MDQPRDVERTIKRKKGFSREKNRGSCSSHGLSLPVARECRLSRSPQPASLVRDPSRSIAATQVSYAR